MALNDIKITKIEHGLGRPAPVEDSTSALVISAGASTPVHSVSGVGMTLATPYFFFSIEDAEIEGIDAAYDAAQGVLLHHHVSEYFRLAPGQPLYVYLVAQGTTLEAMCDTTSPTGLRKLLGEVDGKIRQVGVVLNPAPGYAPNVSSTGIDPDVLAAASKAQETADEVYGLHFPVEVILEGRNFDATTVSAVTDLATLECENVSIVVAQDLDIANDIANAGVNMQTGYACVGTYLGMTAAKGVADSPAEVGLNYQGNLQSLARERFINYGYGNKALRDYTITDQGVIYDKHYVALRTFQGTKGVYFTQSFTCADAENDFLFLELSRTHNKAHRAIYKAYVPYINTKFRLTEQGLLPGEVVKYLENIGNKVFTQMQANGEISAGKTFIDPEQSVVLSRKLLVKWKAVPMGKLEAVDGELSFTLNLE